MRTNGRSRIAIAITALVFAGYVVECAAYYGRYLNGALQFLPPARPFAVEDVLGLGFWLTWGLFAVAFAAAAIYWWRVKATRLHVLLVVVGLFVLVSGIDFALYRTLERQVLSM